MERPHSHLLLGAIVAAILLGLLATAGVALVASVLDVPYDYLTREPQSVLDGDWHTGAFSNLGAVVWSIAAVGALFAASVMAGRERAMFAAVGLLSSALLVDDLFLLHDAVYPRFGVAEEFVQLAYLLAIGAIIVVFRTEMGSVAILGVAFTLGFWALSAFMDKFFNLSRLNLDQLTEDGAKFIGIVVWSATWVTLAHLRLRLRIRPQKEPGAPPRTTRRGRNGGVRGGT